MSLIVTGSIGIDRVEAPTGTVDEVLGGSASYFAAAASFFGPVRLVAAVGADFPARFLKVYKHFKIDLAGLETRAQSKTFRWTGRYHTDMNVRDTVSVQLNVLAEKLPPVPPTFCDSQYIFLANTHPAGQMELLANFPKRRLAVADTMDLWINNEKPTLLKLLKKIDGLVLNDSEATLLTGETNLLRAAQTVARWGPRFIVIKKGEHGAMLVTRQGCAALPAWPTEKVVDPTGAGDSFAGGMMGYLASRNSHALTLGALRQGVAYGTVAASFTIEDFSLGRLLTLTRGQIDARLHRYAAMLRFN
jgi:sugar/nucleoside kinase (ribokinase family)